MFIKGFPVSYCMEKRCECGKIITGTSEKHLASNLKIHMKSKLHKELMKGKGEKKT
jgi:hypothetical protein